MVVELPCGVLHDGEIFDSVTIKELTGRQQNYLVDMDLVSESLGHVPKLLEDLCADFRTKEGKPLEMPNKDIIKLLASEDIEFILIKIREETYGPNFAMPVACNKCGTQQMKNLKLDKLEIAKLKDKKKRTSVITLPKSSQEAEVKLLYLEDLYKLYKIMSEKQSSLYTSTLHLSVKRLGEKTPIEESDLLDLSVADTIAIEEAFVELRGSVDTMVTHECDKCKQEFDSPLPVMDPSFFVQSRTPST